MNQTIDVSGLPESLVQDLRRLVQTLRASLGPQPKPRNIIGLFAGPGIKTPTLEEFQEARREMWASFPRDFPEPTKQ